MTTIAWRRGEAAERRAEVADLRAENAELWQTLRGRPSPGRRRHYLPAAYGDGRAEA
jgi:hypothetical protein